MTSSTQRIIIKGLFSIALFVLIAWLIEAAGLDKMMSSAWIDSEVRSQGVRGELLFICAGIVITGFGLPRQAVSFMGGYAFGFIPGTILAVFATLGGCMASFYYARWFGRDWLATRPVRIIQRANFFLRTNSFNTTLLIRLLPVGSNLLTNVAAGISQIRSTPFFLGSMAGYIPQTAIFALIGSGITIDLGFRIGLGVALFIASGVFSIRLFRSFPERTEA